MKISDLLKMSLSSLWKRKIRTVLTILGVVIGTVSVVVMISLGIGMEKALITEAESYSSLTLIEVTELYSSGDGSENEHLDDSVVEMLESIDHVKYVVPMIETYALLKVDQYQSDVNIIGIASEDFEKMGLKIGEGSYPSGAATSEVELFYGNLVKAGFYNPKTYYYPYYDSGEAITTNFMTDSVYIIFDTEQYNSAGTTDANGQLIQSPKKRISKASGIMKGSLEDYNSDGYYVYMDIDSLKEILSKDFKNRVVPNQPTKSNGSPYKTLYYTKIYVYADKMDNVSSIQTEITNMGYSTYASAEWIQSSMKSMKSTQTMFGIVGGVALVVAAIGIINTMMMSIYERTKEIGIMKVLGCSMRNIQALFILEAAFIGFIGGIIGVGLSFGVSRIVNKSFANDTYGLVTTSSIPLWLVILAIIFATLVGTVAGLLPSYRAMKLSPLEAMRT